MIGLAGVFIFFGLIVFCITSCVLVFHLFYGIIQLARESWELKTNKERSVNNLSEEENVPYPKHVSTFHFYLYNNATSNFTRNLLLIFCSSLLMMILGTLIEILENI